ncbi:MAG TPA: VF530 family protein [Polyangiaceae bacterium]
MIPDGVQPKNPLHGITLERIVTELVARHGWEGLARLVRIRCFDTDPSVSSSLKFLRATPWARTEVEELYLRDLSSAAGRSAGSTRTDTRPPLRKERPRR